MTCAEEATTVAERIADMLGRPLRVGGHDLVITASIGIALGASPQVTSTKLLREADAAMYEAKRRGSGNAIFGESFHAHALG